MSGDAIKVEGLKEFGRRLKAVDKELPKMVRLALNEAANTVVDEAVPNIPRRSGRAARAVKARSTRTMARVAGGSARAAYYPWLDFGGRVGRNNSVERPFKPKGRYLYPAYFKLRDSGEFEEALSESLEDVARRAGIELD